MWDYSSMKGWDKCKRLKKVYGNLKSFDELNNNNKPLSLNKNRLLPSHNYNKKTVTLI